MTNANFYFEKPSNEPVLSYAPARAERALLKAKLEELSASEIEIPLIIGGKEVRTGDMGDCILPHDHGRRIGVYHKAGPEEVQQAIDAAMTARKQWASMPSEKRLAVFMKAADLLAGPYRPLLNAATMLCQCKNAFQAEIDSACELIDFFRFNCYYASQIYRQQPDSAAGVWNRMEYRPLEGFVLAITPFNFMSIAGNLPSAPAIVGNVVLWKPASSAVYSAYHLMRIFMEAGVPEGVINFIPSQGATAGDVAVASEHLAGIHFTGSTAVFRSLWRKVAERIDTYRTYPRLVGETGGKDFIFVHTSAQVAPTVTAMVRGAFEYQGQKCSAASRAYVPESLWEKLRDELLRQTAELKMGPPENFTNFVNAVITRGAFDDIKGYIDYARDSKDAEILIGGECDDSTGYYIAPTVILAKTGDFKTMVEEVFGPVLTIYVYPADKYVETLRLCDETSPYALTGSIFAQDRRAIALAEEVLVNAAGNFYINDKPTGAVVNQQPFGGSRASGTNDKAGSIINVQRWVSPRTIKETFVPPTDWRYTFMDEA